LAVLLVVWWGFGGELEESILVMANGIRSAILKFSPSATTTPHDTFPHPTSNDRWSRIQSPYSEWLVSPVNHL
jgi:hypothetical protein